MADENNPSPNTTTIEVASVEHKEGVSQKNGRPYVIHRITDAKSGRDMSTFDEFAANLKIGDKLDVIVSQNGQYWNFNDPNKPASKSYGGGAAGRTAGVLSTAQSATVHAFQIAATLLAPKFAEKGAKISTDFLKELADQIKPMIETVTPPAAPVAPAVRPVAIVAPAAAPVATQPAVAVPTSTEDTTPAVDSSFAQDEDKPF